MTIKVLNEICVFNVNNTMSSHNYSRIAQKSELFPMNKKERYLAGIYLKIL